MIFKTFDNDIDKWTAKIGIFGKSFNELGNAVKDAFETTIDNIDNFDEDISFWDALKNNLAPKNENGESWLKNSLGEIISKENIDSYISELDLDSAKDKLSEIFNWETDIKNGDATWQDYFDTLKDGEEKYIPDLIKNTDDLSKLTGEDLVNANQAARDAAIAHNAALKQQTLGAKAASVAMKTLAAVGNMIVFMAIAKGIDLASEAISNYIHRVERANEAIDESRSSYEESVSSIDSMNSELQTTQDKINDLQSKGTLSFTDAEELENLRKQNDELERNIDLEEKKKQNSATSTVSKIKNHYDDFKDDFDTKYSIYKNDKEQYESAKRDGQRYVDNGTYSIDEVQSVISDYETAANSSQSDLLDIIDKFEQYKKDINNKYGNNDVSTFSISDRDLYYDITAQLQKAYKLIYSDSEYNKFVIEPIFDTDKLQGLQDQLLQYFSSGGDTDLSTLEDKFGSDIITALRVACENAGIDFNQMIEDMYSNANAKLNRIAPVTNNPNGAYEAQQNNISKTIRDYIQNGLSEEDRTILLNAEIPDDVKFKTKQDVDNFIASLREDVNDTDILSFEQLISSPELSKTRDKLIELSQLGIISEDNISGLEGYNDLLEICGGKVDDLIKKIEEYSTKSGTAFNTINSLDNVKTGLDQLAKTYQDKMDGDSFVQSDLLSSLYEQFGDLSYFDDFINKMMDVNAVTEESQEAFDKLATQFIDTKYNVANLTKENADYVKEALTKNGVTNAEQAVQERLAFAESQRKKILDDITSSEKSAALAKSYHIETSDDLARATDVELIALAKEIESAGLSASSLRALALQKQGVNSVTIDTTTDVSQLLEMAQVAGLSASSLSLLKNAKDGKIKDSKAAESAINSVKNQIKKALSDFTIDYNYKFTGTPSSSSSSGSSSSNTASSKLNEWLSKFFDWIEVRLDRIQKKIDKSTSKAESMLNDKRYNSAISNYYSAISSTYDKIFTEQKASSEYSAFAQRYLDKAVGLGIINKTLASEIKNRVANGSINISEYSEEVQNVITTYKGWIDKAYECNTAINTLHDSLRTYKDKLKDVSDAQRDATISSAESKEKIVTSAIQNSAYTKNSALNYNNAVNDIKNKAYYNAISSASSNVNKLGRSGLTAIGKATIKGNTKYNAALSEAKKYIKAKTYIPLSVLQIIASKNLVLYNRLYMYNLAVDNLEIAREEYATAYAANNSDIYKKIDEKYSNLETEINDAMDLNSSKSTNSVKANTKNGYLDKQKNSYTSILNNDIAKANSYAKSVKSSKSGIGKYIAKGTSIGSAYKVLSASSKATVRKYVDSANSYSKNNKTIPASVIGKLSEYVKKGYISVGFYNSCINYNNALESYNQAVKQAEIDEQTAITQRAEIAQKKLSNISTEYENKESVYKQRETELNNKMAVLEEKGNGASSIWYSRLRAQEQSNYNTLLRQRKSMMDSFEASVKSGDIKKYSTEWYEMKSAIDSVTNAIDESAKALAEYDNQIMQIHWDRINERAQRLQNLIDESNFIINELSRRDLTSNDIGGLTDEGNAVAGLYISNYEAYKKNAQSYYNEIVAINKKLADDPYNQKLIEQKENLTKSYQDAIKAAQDEKFAVIDLWKNGYEALSNKIKNLISEYEQLLDSEKNAYDYQQNIADKTKTIAELRKQLVAYSGDMTEETRAKIQNINVSLANAEKDLKETQYDKYISDTKNMLSDFQDDLDESIQDIIDNLDDNFNAVIESIDDNWSKSNDILVNELLKSIDYFATESFNSNISDGRISENTNSVVNNIYNFLQSAWAKYDSDAKNTTTTDVTTSDNPETNNVKDRIDNLDGYKLGEQTVVSVTPEVGKALSKSVVDKVNNYIASHVTKATKERDKYSSINKALYDAYGKKVLTAAQWTEVAKMMGFSNYSLSTSSEFYKTLHRSGIKGFKNGSSYIPYDMIARVAELGTELQYDRSEGVLRPLGKGDMIFTNEEVKKLQELVQLPSNFTSGISNIAIPNIPVSNNVNNDVNISIGDIKMEGVNNPQEFAKSLKNAINNNTGGVRNQIKEAAIGSLSNNNNSLGIRKY